MAETKQPSVAYQAIEMLRNNKQYGDALADSLRDLKKYKPEQLEEKGVTKGGNINAEGLWAYANKVAEELLGRHNLDPKDPRWKASYQAISSLVKQFGAKGVTSDLVEALIGVYLQTATQYVAEKDQQIVATLPTDQGKKTTMKIAEATGNNVVYGPWINGATDPTEVAGIKAQLEGQLREKVNTAIATGTIDDLLKAA
ncbi:hypothetical protein HYY71_07150 [Candidatus Woesearchaeota archaeon]|nr:hypothetical protein [Candidatus Woesearchaeota archaeon]